MQQKRTKQVLWGVISFALAMLVVWVLSRIFEIIMISPDDVGYEKILSGKTSGVPDGHAYFLRYPLGGALALLYRSFNDVSWYQLFLMGSVVLSMALIFGRVWHIAKGRKILYLTVAALGVVLLFAGEIIHLEWTVIAGILGATALFRFLTMPAQMGKWKSVWEYGVCAVLLVMCFCLRNTVAYLFIPLAGLCWLRRLLDVIWEQDGGKQEKKKKIIRLAVFLLVCLFLVGAVMLAHRLAYSSEDWQAYKDYTKDRSALFDYYGYPDYSVYTDEYEAAGISYEAYLLMKKDYNFVVPCDNFKDMDIKAIADLAQSIHQEDEQGKMQSTLNTIEGILNGKSYRLLNVIIVILMICNFIAYKDKKIIDILFIAAAVLWAAALAFYLAYDGRLPERVVKCLDYGLILTLLGNLVPFWYTKIGEQWKRLTGAKTVISVLLVVALCAVIAQTGWGLLKENKQKEKLAVSHLQILQYCAAHPDNLYFRDFWSFSQRGQLFLNNGYSTDNYQSTGGWTYHSPVYDDMLEKWDCTDLYKAIVENQNIYFLTSKDRYHDSIQHINNYFITAQIPVLMEQVDMFQTEQEEVYVMKFAAQ